MKVADLVRLSKKAQRQRQNRHIAWDDIGFVCKEMSTDKLYYVKWYRKVRDPIHFRNELRFAK